MPYEHTLSSKSLQKNGCTINPQFLRPFDNELGDAPLRKSMFSLMNILRHVGNIIGDFYHVFSITISYFGNLLVILMQPPFVGVQMNFLLQFLSFPFCEHMWNERLCAHSHTLFQILRPNH